MAKKPKNSSKPGKNKQVREEMDTGPSDHETPLFLISTFDLNGPWGVSALSECDHEANLGHIKSYESMTWAEIYKASGGRSSGNNNHPIKVKDLSSNAQARIKVLELDDIEDIVSIRFSGTVRLYGIRLNRILKVLWVDPWHGDATKAVCPSTR